MEPAPGVPDEEEGAGAQEAGTGEASAGEGAGGSGGPVLEPAEDWGALDTAHEVWTYDPAGQRLINWRLEKIMPLSHLDDMAKIARLLSVAEDRGMDHLGLAVVLEQACQDLHGMSLREVSQAHRGGQKIAWGDAPEPLVPPTALRRRTPGPR
jgi:hypothetical protein